MTEPARPRAGCVAWLGAVIGLAALTWAILWITLFRGGAEDPNDAAATGTTAAPTGTAVAPTGTAAAPGCTDATEEFRRFATGPGVEFVQGVCWEPDGQLRAEIELAADVNLDSAPMQGICTALTEFISASDRPWLGFIGYSSSPLSPGQAILTRPQPDQPCENPARR